MGEVLYRARVALLVCFFTMISAVPATWTSEMVDQVLKSTHVAVLIGAKVGNDPASQVVPNPPSVSSSPSDAVEGPDKEWPAVKWLTYATLLAASVYLAYLTASAIGTVAAEVVGSDTMEEVDVLVLPVSKQIRDSHNKSIESIKEHKELLEALVEGDATLVTIEPGRDQPQLVPTFSTMTESETRIILGSKRVSPADFSWQQSWRTVREQISSGKLKEIVLVKSTSSLNEEADREFRSFQRTLEYLIKNEQSVISDRYSQGLLKITEKTPSNNGIEAVQELYHKIIKATPRGQRVGIDITSGDRIYAFAAGLSALHEKAVMFYVSTTDTEGKRYDDPKVACYDVRPKFRSS